MKDFVRQKEKDDLFLEETYGWGFEPNGVSIKCKLAEQVFSPAGFSALHVYSHSSFSFTCETAKR